MNKFYIITRRYEIIITYYTITQYKYEIILNCCNNFGSEHDPDDTLCSPGTQKGGNFIMYRRATTGTDRNNRNFSDCSRDQMGPILHALVTGYKFCFKRNCLSLSNRSFCVYLRVIWFYFKSTMGRFVESALLKRAKSATATMARTQFWPDSLSSFLYSLISILQFDSKIFCILKSI